MSGIYMQPLSEELSQKYIVYVPDLPGFGKSSKPPHVLSIQELAEALFIRASAIPVERVWSWYESVSLIMILLKDYMNSGIKRVIKTFEYSLQYKFEESIKRIKVPAVVVWDENDKLVSGQWVRQAKLMLPDVNLVKS